MEVKVASGQIVLFTETTMVLEAKLVRAVLKVITKVNKRLRADVGRKIRYLHPLPPFCALGELIVWCLLLWPPLSELTVG
jgi:hypothetical protein